MYKTEISEGKKPLCIKATIVTNWNHTRKGLPFSEVWRSSDGGIERWNWKGRLSCILYLEDLFCIYCVFFR